MSAERSKQTERAGLRVLANNSITLVKPEHIMKLSSIIVDALEYCQNDVNFKTKRKDVGVETPE